MDNAVKRKQNTLILWGPLYLTTIGMFLLVLLFWVVYQPIATLLLFAIICLWSRVPCMVSWFTKDMDLIDFFVVFLAININGLFAGFFGLGMMLFSRIFGPMEEIDYTIKDGFGFFFGGLITPIVYYLTGQNLLITMYLFTIVGRYAFVLLEDLVFSPGKLMIDAGLMLAGLPIAYFSNTFLVTVFGEALNGIFDTGMNVNIGLFFTVVVVGAVFFLLSKIIERGEKDVKSIIKYREAIQPHFMQEPHKIFFSYFSIDHVPALISGSFRNFRLKLFLLTLGLMAAIIIYFEYSVKWYEFLLLSFIMFVIVNVLTYIIHLLLGNEEAKSHIR